MDRATISSYLGTAAWICLGLLFADFFCIILFVDIDQTCIGQVCEWKNPAANGWMLSLVIIVVLGIALAIASWIISLSMERDN